MEKLKTLLNAVKLTLFSSFTLLLHGISFRKLIERFKYFCEKDIIGESGMENQIDKEVVELVRKIVQEQVENAKAECFKLANPENLDYEQLSFSEKTLYDFCSQIDGYDVKTLEKLRDIINKVLVE